MNKIRLNFDQMREIVILPTAEDLEAIWTHILENGFVFNEFTLIAEPIATTFKVRIEGTGDDQIIHIKIIQYNKGLAHTTTKDMTIDDYFNNFFEMMQEVTTNGYTRKALDNETSDILIPFHFMQYVIYADMHKQVEYIEPRERESGSSTSRKTYKAKSQEYSLTDCIKIYHHTSKHRKQYEYTIGAFPVRGHFRRNNNGTISWVRPFTKGKDREIIKDTEYKL